MTVTTIRPNLFTMSLLIAGVLLLSGLSGGTATASEQEEISQQQKRIEQSIKGHRKKLKKSGEKEKDLLEQLNKIDRRLLRESSKYVNLQQQIHKQENLIREKQQELEELRKEKKDLKLHIRERLTAYYQMGDIGIVNAVFSASSVSELLNFREMYGEMLSHDRKSFMVYKDKIEDITGARKTLEKQRRELAESVSRAEKQQQILAEKREKRDRLLNKVQTRKKLYQNALNEMEAASQELRMTLTDLNGQPDQGNRGQPDGGGPLKDNKKREPISSRKGFVGQKGRLIPPVAGKVIKKFNQDPATGEGLTFSEGINIRTEPDDKIRAVYKGEVIYAGTQPGYGKIIIIDHGNHYVSLISGIGEFIKEVGEEVGKGDIVATPSLHSSVLQDGIHFEIRHETEPVDPLAWLNSSELEIQ